VNEANPLSEEPCIDHWATCEVATIRASGSAPNAARCQAAFHIPTDEAAAGSSMCPRFDSFDREIDFLRRAALYGTLDSH
jgi:hypothetical protein